MRVKSDNQSVTMPNHYRGSGRFCAGAGQPGMIRACPARFGYPKNDSQPQRSHSGGQNHFSQSPQIFNGVKSRIARLESASLKKRIPPLGKGAPATKRFESAPQAGDFDFEIALKGSTPGFGFFSGMSPFFFKIEGSFVFFPRIFLFR